MKKSAVRCRGFLTHALALLPVLAAVGVFATLLFNESMGSMRRVREQQAAGDRADLVLAKLRTDVWNAQTLDVSQSQRVALQTGGGEQIVWQMAEGNLRRTVAPRHNQPAETLEWAGFSPIVFERRGPILQVRDGSDPRRQWAMVSQVLSAGNGPVGGVEK